MSEAASEVVQTEPDDSVAHNKPGMLWVILLFVAVLLAYPLSIGPVGKYYKGRPVPQFVTSLYKPVGALCGRSEAAGQILVWYLDLWGVHYHG
jgi:hypothetical protein